MNPTTPEERRAYAAQRRRDWMASPAGREAHKRRQERLRHTLFNPDWTLRPDKKAWKIADDVLLLSRERSDRELAKSWQLTIPAVRQRRIRLRRLLYTAAGHAQLAADQIAYHEKLTEALKERGVVL